MDMNGPMDQWTSIKRGKMKGVAYSAYSPETTGFFKGMAMVNLG